VAATIGVLTISGSATFNAASAPTGEAKKSKVWHSSTTDKLMADIAASGAKYFVMSPTTDTALSGLTSGKMVKATGADSVGDATNTDTDVADAVTKKHAQNTDTGTTGATWTVDSDSTTGKIVVSAAAGAADKSLTITNAALTEDRTVTIPDSTGVVNLGTITANTLPKGTAVAGVLADSSIKDDGTTVSTTQPVSVNRAGIATTSTDGLVITNDTAATVGVPMQYSPRLRLRGQAWATSGAGSNDTWDSWMQIVPSSWTSTGAFLSIYGSKNGAAAVECQRINLATQSVTVFGSLSVSSNVFGNAGLTAGTFTNIQARQIKTVWSQYSWTNAMVVALGAVASGDVTVCTLPAKTRVVACLIVIDTAGTNMGGATYTVQAGTDATFSNYIATADALATTNTVYGDADVELGDDMKTSCKHLPSWTGTTPVKVRFTTDEAGGKTLADVQTSTGSIYFKTELLP